jgi:hypothetical protein
VLALLTLLLATTPPTAEAPTHAALVRAGEWMAAYAANQSLNFDAVIVLSLLRRSIDTPGLTLAFERAHGRLDRDRGHPLRRLVDPEFRLPPELSRGWAVPEGAAPRINPDRVLTEALYCDENGWRRETADYVCGALRDAGGYYSAHALWAVVLARERGCFLGPDAQACTEALRRELLAAQPLFLVPWSTLDIDLFAERLVMLLLSGPLPAWARDGARQLLVQQGADGSWGVAAPGEPPYLRFHATMMAAWALTLAAAEPAPANR